MIYILIAGGLSAAGLALVHWCPRLRYWTRAPEGVDPRYWRQVRRTQYQMDRAA